MRHLLLADVDGTILPSGESVPSPETVAAVGRFYANGGKLVPVTSNSEVLLRPVAHQLSLKDHGLLDGGATIYDYATGRRNEQLSRWLDGDKALRVASALAPFIMKIYYDENSTERTPETLNLDEVERTPSIFAIYRKQDEAKIERRLKAIPGISTHPNKYEEIEDARCVQIVEKGVSKQSAVNLLFSSEVYQDYLGSDTAAVGDGENDKHLMWALRPGGLSIAMGNASTVLKAMTQVQVAGVREGGFVEVIDKHMLGRV